MINFMSDGVHPSSINWRCFMENKELKKVFFLGVSNNERNNIAYSNFIYSLCYYCLSKMYTHIKNTS